MISLTASDLLHLFVSIGSLLLLARLNAYFAKKIKIPAVLGEIVLGILIGPTLLGTISPGLSQWLFPVEKATGVFLQGLIQIAVIMLLFVAGLETNLKALKAESKTVLLTGLGSTLIPFLSGFILVWFFPALFTITADQKPLLSFFIGIALAISALPVIIRILMDLNLYRSKIGVITITAASIMDLLGWLAFAIILGNLHPLFLQDSAKTLWAHATPLSFIAGIFIGNYPIISAKIRKLAYILVTSVLSPLFFLSIGVKVNFIKNLDFNLIITLLLVATVSKLTGTFLGGKLGGLNSKDALAVGFALNARGAMEILLSKQAFEVGLIQPSIFVGLVIMALFTSLLSGPAIHHLILSQPNKGKNYAPSLKTKTEQVITG